MVSLSLDEFFERAEKNPDSIKNGHNLTANERGVIDPEDTWVVAYIQELPLEEMVRMGHCFRAMDMKHYMGLQKKWLEKEIILIGGRIHRRPDDIELIEDAQNFKNMERYRLCYVLEFPHKVAFHMHYYSRAENRYDADVFLAEATKLHRIPFPYFELIWCNTLLNKPE